MRLNSFQVKECFGFRDSGQVDLKDIKNLIYVLGRNSSGKTSFLTALAHFSPRLTPQSHSNFLNFDSSSIAPSLLGEYQVAEGDLKVAKFANDFRIRIEEINRGMPNVTVSNEYKRVVEELMIQLVSLYTKFVNNAMSEGHLWVSRDATGLYRFSTQPDFNDSNERRTKLIPSMLASIPQQLGIQANIVNTSNGQLLIGGVWQPFKQLTPDEIESLLANQLSTIAWFNQTYSLLDTIPEVITIEHVKNSPGPLTTALVTYLGKPQVERFLQVQNPIERRKIEDELQQKMNALIEEVNRGRTTDMELLKIDLSRVDGLQVTTFAGGKPSYYRHLSDNTKFLFAYHLYKNVYNLSGNILLFDEPNNGFHAMAQERLLGFLQNLGATGNLVIISTHSEHLIDSDHLTGVRLMIADDEGYLSVRNKWYAPTTGKGDFQALRPILDAIGLRYGANHLTIRDKVIVTEGVTELLYLRAFRQLFGDTRELHIAPATGDDTISSVVALLIAQGLQFKIVVDTEANRKTIKEKLQEDYDIPDESICEVEIPRGFPLAKGSGIEDVFSKADFAKLLAATCHKLENDFDTLPNSKYMKKPKIVPKRVVAHQFNANIATFSTSDFEEETLTNMRRILDFCMNDDWFLL